MTRLSIGPITDHLPVAIRAYATPLTIIEPKAFGRKVARRPSKVAASPWTLIFDTETTSDAGQSLRFGTYQVRKAGVLDSAGIFYAPEGVTADELAILRNHAERQGMVLLTREEFADQIFFGIAWKCRAAIVGFNLPFDISRIAISYSSARTSMRGGFSFKISDQKIYPHVQVKHLSQRMAFIRFAATMRQPDARSARKRGHKSDHRPGHFVDVKTLAGALLSRSFTLASLSTFLKVDNGKLAFDDFDGPVTDDMVTYAVRDTQATWECYAELVARLDLLRLGDVTPDKIYSEASLGKAYMRAMGVQSWQRTQPDFPAQNIADIMGTYYGGRSEIRIRRERRQIILCDFLSMYPTVCTLMGLWRVVIADGMTWRDATVEARSILEAVDLESLKSQSLWKRLSMLVRVIPDGDVFPVRASYAGEAQTTIGSNHLTSDAPVWFTLADCVAAKLASGKAPTVIQAVAYESGPIQDGLRPVDIQGNPEYRIDPVTTDYFQRLIELRQSVKVRRDQSSGEERDALDTVQNNIKIAANSTTYGMYVEINVAMRTARQPTTVHSSTSTTFDLETKTAEEPGPYFHPLLATLITGAARLMLAISERLIVDQGLDWMFCDTDSMAIAKPEAMPADEFRDRAATVVAWFADLNPYEFGGSILKVEDVNFALDDAMRSEPLYGWAVSSKRYALFNLSSDGSPVMRKVSAHGLGHLLPPYGEGDPATGIPEPHPSVLKEGIARWHSDLWFQIVSAALAGHPNQIDRTYHPALARPAMSRYGATTPELLGWFRPYNRGRSFRDQVKPFGFLLAMSARQSFEGERILEGQIKSKKRSAKRPMPISPFDRDFEKAVTKAFDRLTGQPVPVSALKSYADALAQYHIQPESKFLNADYLDRGTTIRRHVRMTATRHIGKESNDWERQAVLGLDEDCQPEYGVSVNDRSDMAGLLKAFVKEVGLAKASEALRIGPSRLKPLLLRTIYQQDDKLVRRVMARLPDAIRHRAIEGALVQAQMNVIRQSVGRFGLRETARWTGIDPSNLRRKLAVH